MAGLRIKAKAIAKSQMRSMASVRPSPRNVQLAASFAPTGWLDPAIAAEIALISPEPDAPKAEAYFQRADAILSIAVFWNAYVAKELSLTRALAIPNVMLTTFLAICSRHHLPRHRLLFRQTVHAAPPFAT